MINSNPYTMTLANGKEKTFATAAEMVTWLDKQRGLEYSPKRPARSAKQRRRGRIQGNRSMNADTDKTPLARYANRNSDEA